MKKKILIGILLFVFASGCVEVKAEPKLMRVTCYYQNSGVTYSGSKPKPNLTAAGAKDTIGSVADVYRNDNGNIGAYIGRYQIEDTGSHKRITSGKSIDIYQSNLSDCKEFVSTYGDYLFVNIVRGEG